MDLLICGTSAELQAALPRPSLACFLLSPRDRKGGCPGANEKAKERLCNMKPLSEKQELILNYEEALSQLSVERGAHEGEEKIAVWEVQLFLNCRQFLLTWGEN